MDLLTKNLDNLKLNNNEILYEQIKHYIDVIHTEELFTNSDVINKMDNYWKSINTFILYNLIDYINESINDNNNEIIQYLKMDLYVYKSNINMFLDYLMHTVFY